MTGNRLKQHVMAGGNALGGWMMSGAPVAAEVMSMAGYHFVILDLEHGPGDSLDLAHMLRAVACGGAEPVVRVAWNDPVLLKRVLDIGARSIMVPMVETVEEAEAAVAACRYPPRGRRGYAAPVVRASRYGLDAEYADQAHDELFLWVQIESAKGIENAAAIAAVDGVDCLFLGPNDLAGSINRLGQLDHPDVLALIDRLEKAVLPTSKVLGTIPMPNLDATALAKRGYRIVAGGADLAFLRMSSVADIERHAAAFPAL